MSACIHREPVADRDPRVAVQLARWMFSWKSTSMNSRRAVILSGTRLHGIAPGCSTHPPDDSARLVDTACAVTGHTLVSVDMRFGFIADDREMYEWETLGWVLMLVGLDMRVGSKSRDTTLYLVSRVPLPIVCICDSPESLGEDHLIEYLCTRLPVEDPPARVINTPVRNATGCIGDPRLVWQLAHWLESWKPTNEKRSVLITGGGCTGKTTSARMVCDVARYDVANILASNVLSLRDLMKWYRGGDKFVMVLEELDMRPGSESYDAVAKLLRDPPFPVVCIGSVEPEGECADFFARYCTHLYSRSG